MSVNGFTPTQCKILEILSDGMPHLKQEIFDCLDNPFNNPDVIFVHICHIRKHLRPKGQDIICEYIGRRTHYRHVRLLKSPSEG